MTKTYIYNHEQYLALTFIKQHSNCFYIMLNRVGTIVDCNIEFMSFFGLTEKPSGHSIVTYIQNADDLQVLDNCWQARTEFTKIKLFLSTATINTTGFVFNCHCKEELLYLYGEPIVNRDSSIMQEFSRLSNELNNINREMFKKNKELETLMHKLQEAHSAKEQLLEHYINSEKELHKMTEAAERANKIKSQFLANMSHEIRTPMNVIIGITDLVYSSNLDTEQREYMEMVKNAASSLLAIINDILDFSKIEAGKMRLECTNYNLQQELNKITSWFTVQVREKKLALKTVVADGLPAVLYGDPVRIGQVLVNLISNAIKFTEKGEILVTVTTKDNNCDNNIMLFSVTDTGRGISAEKIDYLFEEFTQLDGSNSREHQGTGLGLSIAKKLVEMMGGTIGATSELGRGSTFFFELPLVVTEEELSTPEEQQITLAKTTDVVLEQDIIQKKDKELNVLLVEDRPMNQKLATILLEQKGWSVTVANNGQEALELTEHNDYDVVLMDVQMPIMDGLQATTKIREREQENGKRVPIIAMTANVMQEDIDDCKLSGMDSYIAKPINRDVLYKTILGVVGQ